MKTDKPLTLGDILKSEADPNSRLTIDADAKIKIGQLVIHPTRQEPLFALSNTEHGKVLIQPHNCVICLDKIAEETITSYKFGDSQTPLTLDLLRAQGDKHGIKYIGTPYTA